MDSSKPVAICQKHCHLHRAWWLGASVSDGEWLCCAKRLSRCWQLRPLAWLHQQWRWRVAAEAAAAAMAAALAAALAVAVSTAAALAVAASMAAWLADSVAAGSPADSEAVNFVVVDSVITTSGAAASDSATRMTTTPPVTRMAMDTRMDMGAAITRTPTAMRTKTTAVAM